MPLTPYIKVKIGDMQVQVEKPEDLPVTINYSLEDTEDFQSKTSTNALALKVPATLLNEQAANTYRNPDVEDMTTGKQFSGFQPCVIEANGYELLVGRAVFKSAKHTDKPTSYEYDLYGGNGDWMIALTDSTIYDFIKQINYPYTKQQIIDSWVFDGTDETLPYVIAPVRYANEMATGYKNLVLLNPTPIYDYNMTPDYMKPSISKYFIIYWALKSVGYRIQSTFLDSSYFRRQVMPWTWGSYLTSEGTILDDLKFEAQSTEPLVISHTTFSAFVDLKVANDYYNNMNDKSNTYTYDTASKEMRWTYPSTSTHGQLTANFAIDFLVTGALSTFDALGINIYWYKNGSFISNERVFDNASSTGNIPTTGLLAVSVVPGDVVSCRVFIGTYHASSDAVNVTVSSFKLDYFRKELQTGLIQFADYIAFKNYKVLDLFRGIVDEFNLAVNTDAVNKIVYIEPTHPYSLDNNSAIKHLGYFNGNSIDWTNKQDISKESTLDSFSDSEKQLIFRYKDDGADGILKKIQDKTASVLGSAKFVLPDRFKIGKKVIENRFFSPTMHYDVLQWQDLTGLTPQMICIIPENISNTSAAEAGNTFAPKSVYYKGNIAGVGGWKFDGDTLTSFPFMFAVNYQPGGETDPVLSYSDERIGIEPNYTIGRGHLKRFYLQRMAVMRNGQYYTTNFRLINSDVTNQMHKEHVVLNGQRYELVQVTGYKPLVDDSTACFMRKHAPVSLDDFNNCYPGNDSVIFDTVLNTYDLKYARLKCLSSDV